MKQHVFKDGELSALYKKNIIAFSRLFRNGSAPNNYYRWIKNLTMHYPPEDRSSQITFGHGGSNYQHEIGHIRVMRPDQISDFSNHIKTVTGKGITKFYPDHYTEGVICIITKDGEVFAFTAESIGKMTVDSFDPEKECELKVDLGEDNFCKFYAIDCRIDQDGQLKIFEREDLRAGLNHIPEFYGTTPFVNMAREIIKLDPPNVGMKQYMESNSFTKDKLLELLMMQDLKSTIGSLLIPSLSKEQMNPTRLDAYFNFPVILKPLDLEEGKGVYVIKDQENYLHFLQHPPRDLFEERTHQPGIKSSLKNSCQEKDPSFLIQQLVKSKSLTDDGYDPTTRIVVIDTYDATKQSLTRKIFSPLDRIPPSKVTEDSIDTESIVTKMKDDIPFRIVNDKRKKEFLDAFSDPDEIRQFHACLTESNILECNKTEETSLNTRSDNRSNAEVFPIKISLREGYKPKYNQSELEELQRSGIIARPSSLWSTMTRCCRRGDRKIEEYDRAR